MEVQSWYTYMHQWLFSALVTLARHRQSIRSVRIARDEAGAELRATIGYFRMFD